MKLLIEQEHVVSGNPASVEQLRQPFRSRPPHLLTLIDSARLACRVPGIKRKLSYSFIGL
jgi:hypothetical protein